MHSQHHGGSLRQSVSTAAGPDPMDVAQFAGMVTMEFEAPEKMQDLERLASALQVPLGTAKNMVFKRKALLSLTAEDVATSIDKVASTVQVTQEQARKMVALQPGLLFDTDKQAETLNYGIQAICYELDAPKDEVIDLILNNPSVLSGRELRLSVADMAHLAMLREPRGRIVD